MTDWIQLTDSQGAAFSIRADRITMVGPAQVVGTGPDDPPLTQAANVWVDGIPGHWRVRETYDEIRALLDIAP